MRRMRNTRHSRVRARGRDLPRLGPIADALRHTTLFGNVKEACLDQLEAAKHWVLLPFLMASVAEIKGDHEDIEGAVALLGPRGQIGRVDRREMVRGRDHAPASPFPHARPERCWPQAAASQPSSAKARSRARSFGELRTATPAWLRPMAQPGQARRRTRKRWHQSTPGSPRARTLPIWSRRATLAQRNRSATLG